MTVMTLPDRLDLSQISDLTEQLKSLQGEDLTLDAGKVTHLGALGLQLLLVAQAAWAEAGQNLFLTPRSPEFMTALAIFGIDPARFLGPSTEGSA